MNFYVYLICSKNNNNRLISYVGYTNNVVERLKKHNSNKGAKSTKGYKWIVIYKKRFKIVNRFIAWSFIIRTIKAIERN